MCSTFSTILGVCIPSVCLTCMIFELTGDVCITLSRCGSAFGTVSHVQQSVRRVAKCIERVPGSERGFEHLTEREDMVVS